MCPKGAAPPTGIAAYVIDCLADVGPVECRRFFGGWGLRLHGTQFAMVMEDQLYFSVAESFRIELKVEGCVPFSYGKRGRTIVVEKYYTAPLACLDDVDELCRWAIRAINGVATN